ncbi:MAG: cobyrinate a,c-diamide synthase [Candidatus Bipolaricaulota bacterium]|nr:cobyrinate a,c-diamide synthase [Candidatus Bipolaricaulota bacterium]
MKGIIIAGTRSGVGKTVATLVVLRALENLGEEPQPAKIGPDFIDPSHHRYLTGKPSRTLDLWLEGREGLVSNYHRGEGSICVAEGVMGLYDGNQSSTAKVAEVLDIPIVLVVDGSAGMDSVAATALGFRDYAEYRGLDIEIAGIISQKTRRGTHEQGIMEGLPDELVYFGSIPPLKDLEIPERHLGLFMGEQSTISEDKLDRAGSGVDVELLMETAREPSEPEMKGSPGPVNRKSVRVGMAYDPAFNFVYPRTRERLEATELVTFSPLEEDRLPDVDGIYLPGGYPELHPERLAKSRTIDDIAARAKDGVPVFGECGGMMVMSQALRSKEGEDYEMAGILPAEVEMVEDLQGLGYVELKGEADSPICSAGGRLRGHEFHYSRIKVQSGADYAFQVEKGEGMDDRHEGLVRYNSLGTYTHFHPESGAFDSLISWIEQL